MQIISDSVEVFSKATPACDTLYNSALHKNNLFVHQLHATIANFVDQDRSSHKLCLRLTRRPLNNKPLYSHSIRFHSTWSDAMVVFRPRRHLRQNSQLGAKRLCFSLKCEYLELQCCREMPNTREYLCLRRR